MDSSLGLNPCFSCVSSCCKLEVQLTKEEYNKLEGLEEYMEKESDKFIEKYPDYEKRREFLEEMYSNTYATIKKGEDGYCIFLDRETRLCSIYDRRPAACSDFSNESKRCKKIRTCIN